MVCFVSEINRDDEYVKCDSMLTNDSYFINLENIKGDIDLIEYLYVEYSGDEYSGRPAKKKEIDEIVLILNETVYEDLEDDNDDWFDGEGDLW